MTDRPCWAGPSEPPVAAASIDPKDRVIRRQAKRIEALEREVVQLHGERQRLNAKIASLLSSNSDNEQQLQQRQQQQLTTRDVSEYDPVCDDVEMNSVRVARPGNNPVSGTTSFEAPKFNAGPTRIPRSDRGQADIRSCSLAARTIQLAYRRYLMNKNFARLCSDAERSKRLVQRTQRHPESCGGCAEEEPLQNGYTVTGIASHPKTRGLGTIDEHISESARVEDGSRPHAIYPELSDSSDSESVLEMAHEPAFDESSSNFEHLLEAEEADGADDSFNSEGSQEGEEEPFSSRCSTLRAGGNFPGFPHQWSSLTSSVESADCNEKTSTLRTRLSDSDSMSGDGSMAREPLEDVSSFETSSFGSGSHVSSDSLRLCSTDGNFDAFFNFCTSSYSPIWKRKTDSAGSTGSLPDASAAHGSSAGSADAGQNGGEPSRCSVPDDAGTVHRHGHIDPSDVLRHPAPPHASQPGVLHGAIQDARCHHVLNQRDLCDVDAFSQSDRLRKRTYRIGLNLFNRKPERGVKYLIENKFIDLRPNAVARFLVSRKGLSRQMIGEYLGNIQKPFNIEVLRCFADEIDLVGLQVDVALRKYQSFFRMPGEAQKIERLMEVFAHRYCACNADQVKNFWTPDTVFLLAFAIVMLNTDQHNKCIKDDRRMKTSDFINNLRGIDDGHDVDHDLLAGIFDRVRSCEFKPASDHVSQVAKVEEMIVGKKPSLQLVSLHRRLVCYCRLYEVPDLSKQEKVGSHQRELFLFNDLLVVTKMMSKKRKSVSYSFRQIFSLHRVAVYLFETPYYRYGVRLMTAARGKELITLCARNEHDRLKFVDDLKETILELEEMEILESYDGKKDPGCHGNANRGHDSRQGSREVNRHSKDSGVADVGRLSNRSSDCDERKNSISSSVFDFSERHRTESRSSLDSGLASTGSSSANSCTEPVKLRSHSATIASGYARETASRKNKTSN